MRGSAALVVPVFGGGGGAGGAVVPLNLLSSLTTKHSADLHVASISGRGSPPSARVQLAGFPGWQSSVARPVTLPARLEIKPVFLFW